MKKLILILFLATLSIYGQINGTGSGGKNYVSAVNSTVTALDSAATFTGGWELCWDYSYIQVVIKSNIGGTGKIQFSKSGTTATLLHQNTFTYTANDTLTNKVQVETAGNYYRIVYTNSTTDQTSFSLLTTMVARERLPLSNNQISITDTSSNTSLNDIESNSDAIKTSVEIMDDWDETNRAKVNLIVGEPGVSANRGSSDSTTQRVTIANNDSTVTLQKSIRDKIDTLEVTVNNIEDKVSTEAKQDTIINRVTATNLALAVTNDTLKTFKQANHTDLSNIQAKQDSAEVTLNIIAGKDSTSMSRKLVTITNDSTSLSRKLITITNDSTSLSRKNISVNNFPDSTQYRKRVQTDIISSALPSGASTSALQDSILAHLSEQVDTLKSILLNQTNRSQKTQLTNGVTDVMVENGATYDALYVRLTDGSNPSSLSGTGDLEVSGDGGSALALDASVDNIEAKQDTQEVSLNAIVSSLNDNLKGGTKYYGLTDTVTTRVDTTTFTDATKWIEGQLVADDSIEVAINGAFTTGETWIITVTTPVDLVRWDAVTSNKLYVRRYGSAGTPRFYIRVTSR